MDFETAVQELNGKLGKIAGFYSKKYPMFTADELKQEALIAVWQATKLFDPDRGVKFFTYAFPRIKFKIEKYIREEIYRDEIGYGLVTKQHSHISHPEAGNIELRKYNFKELLKPRLQKFVEKRYGL